MEPVIFIYLFAGFFRATRTDLNGQSEPLVSCMSLPSHSDFVTRPPSFLSSVMAARLKNDANSDCML